jgi:hypothetical protein
MEATLLQLPAELRNRIYEYALTDPSSTGLRFKAFLIVNVTICKPLLLGTNGEQFNALKACLPSTTSGDRWPRLSI